MRGKKEYKAYQNGAQYGKFGSGDHESEGGKVVKGVTGPIHIMAGVETDIMKAHGPEGEHILAQKKGYSSVWEAKRINPNEITGYAQYGIDDFVPKWAGGSGKAYEADWWTGPSSIGDQISEGLQDLFNVSADYDPDLIAEREQKGQLKTMLGTSQENILAGQKKTEAFIGENLQSDLEGLTRKEDRLDAGIIGTQRDIVKSTGAGRNIQTKTNLVSGGPDITRDIEQRGKMSINKFGDARQDIWATGDKFQRQADMDIYKTKQQAQTALGQIYSDYMSATGEPIGDEQMTLLQEYMIDNDVSTDQIVDAGNLDQELEMLQGSGNFNFYDPRNLDV